MVDLLTDIRVDADRGEAVLYRRVGRRRSIERVEFRPHLRCAREDIVEAPEVQAVAKITRLAGDAGFRWRLEPQPSSNIFDVERAVVHVASKADGEDYPSYFDVRHIERTDLQSAFLMKSGMRVFQGATPEDIRVAALIVESMEQRVVGVAVHGLEDELGQSRYNAQADEEDEKETLRWCVAQLRDLDPDIIVVEAGTDPIRALFDRCRTLGIACLLGPEHDEPRYHTATETFRIPGRQVVRLKLNASPGPSASDRARTLAHQARDALPAWLLLASRFPLRLDELMLRRAAPIDAALVAAHETQGLAVPQRVEKKGSVEGAKPWLREAGLYRDVHHVDLVSAYANVIATFGIRPTNDRAGAFLTLVRDLLAARATCAAAGNAGAAGVIKTMLTTAFGYLNTGNQHFADALAMQQVVDETAAILRRMVDAVEDLGGQVLWHHTDGLLFRGVDTERVCAALKQLLGSTHPFAHEGPFSVLLVDKASRVIRHADGSTVWKGNLLSGLRDRPNLQASLKSAVEELVGGDDGGAERIVSSLVLDASEERAWCKAVRRLLRPLGAQRFTSVFGKDTYETVQRTRLRRAFVGTPATRTIQRAGLDARERLRTAGQPVDLPPCVRSHDRRRAKGRSIPRELTTKARAERRILESSGSGDSRKKPGTVTLPVVDERDSEPSAEDMPTVRCGHPAIGQHCTFADCYRSQGSDLFDDSAWPIETLEADLRPQVRAELSRRLPFARPIFLEAMCRSGKTYQTARRAAELVAAGFRVQVIVPTHDAGRVFMEYLDEFWGRGSGHAGKRAVHIYGRSDESCVLDRKHCVGCPRNEPNWARADRRAGIFELKKLKSVAEKSESCARTASWRLAKQADLVVFTHAALVHEGSRRLLPRVADFTFVEEGDQLADSMQSELTRTLTLAWSGTRRPLVDGEGCTFDCDHCQLSLPTGVVLDDGPYARGAFDSDGQSHEPARLIQVLLDGITVLQALPDEVACGVDFAALSENIEVLSDAVHELPNTGSPQDKLISLGRKLTELGYTPPLGVLDDPEDPEGQPISLPFTLCVDDEPGLLSRVKKALVKWPAKCLDVALITVVFAEFVHAAASRAGGALLSPRPKPARWARHQPSCRLELTFFDMASAGLIRDRLRSGRTMLLSGTIGDPELAALRLLLDPTEVEHRSVNAPMHQGFTMLTHTTGPGGVSAPGIPRKLSGEHIRDLLIQISDHQRGTEPLRALVFTPKKAAAQRLFDVLRKVAGEGIEVELVEGTVRRTTTDSETTNKPNLKVTIDYLRSSGTRARDRDFDLVVMTGKGLPNYSNSHAYIDAINQTHTGVVTPLDVADDNRMRTLVQAMMRVAGLGGAPRLVLTLNDLAPHDLPLHLQSRALPAHPLYRNLTQGKDVAGQQVARLATECARILAGHPPRRDGHRLGDLLVRDWNPSEQITRRVKRSMFRLVLSSTSGGKEITPKQLATLAFTPSSEAGTWKSLLEWLVVEGLVVISKRRPVTYQGCRHATRSRLSVMAERIAKIDAE